MTLSIFIVVISFHHIVAPTARGSMWTWRSEKEFYQKVHDAIGPDQYLLATDELRQLKARAPVFTNIAFNQALIHNSHGATIQEDMDSERPIAHGARIIRFKFESVLNGSDIVRLSGRGIRHLPCFGTE